MTTQHYAITTDPLGRNGRPCVRDLRISVSDVLGWLALGHAVEKIVADYRPQPIPPALDNVGNDAVLGASLGAAERLQRAFDDPAAGVLLIESTKPKPAPSTSTPS